MKFEINKLENQTIISVFTDYFKVTLSNFGASLVGLNVNNEELILSPINYDNILEPNYYYGKVIGAITNRIENGELTIDGIKYFMDKNEGNNTHHGGPNGLSNRIFEYRIDDKKNSIIFTYLKKHLEDGLPGNVKYKITYKFEDSIQVIFEAKSNKNTIISLTNHPFFCLKAKDVNKIKLKAKCDSYVYSDSKTLLPIKEETVDKYLDFNRLKRIGKYINNRTFMKSKAKGYDHNLIFSENKQNNKIQVEDDSYRIIIKTDFEGFHIYSDNYKTGYKFKDVALDCRSAIAIEPCDILTRRQVLKAGEKYKRKIRYYIKDK